VASENLELARSIWAHWEKGDFSATHWADPEIEFVEADLPDGAARVGIHAMNEAWTDFLRNWHEFSTHPEEYIELDEERVAVLAAFSGRGKHSGMNVRDAEMKGVLVFHIRDEKVTKMVMYYNRERGLEELGRAED
jgi:ketosteroid isomerase-like protein